MIFPGFLSRFAAPDRIRWTVLILFCSLAVTVGREPDAILDLWEGPSPEPVMNTGPEKDFTKPEDTLIAGRRIIKLGNVSTPQLHVFHPPAPQANRSAVLICPGGGYSILAWDLEGTEVADWLNSLGVTALVLKYRVPTGQLSPRWLGPVQDAQRALSLTRAHASDWKIHPDRIGILGFSAGGHAAAVTSFTPRRHYPAADPADQQSCRPNFTVLIYPGYLVNQDRTALHPDLPSVESAPPTFLAHAADDGVPMESSLLLFQALRRHKINAELHVYSQGGHGYGLRKTTNPVTTWQDRCADWLEVSGWLPARPSAPARIDAAQP